MLKNGEYQYSLIRELSFTRFGGTEKERMAAEILQKWIVDAGGKGAYMEFPIPVYSSEKCIVNAGEPMCRPVEAAAYRFSGNLTPAADLQLVYADDGAELDFLRLPTDGSRVALLVNELTPEVYRRICRYCPAAFLTISGKMTDDPSAVDLVGPTLKPELATFGKIPGLCIRAVDAMQLVSGGVSTVQIELVGKQGTGTSGNVLAVIPGEEKPEEALVLAAHYDSVSVGTGSWDNASGAANLMFLYQYFLSHPPKRTMRFVWCGSEEQGLLGSQAYAAGNPNLLDAVKLCFNFDMCGTILGHNCIHVTGDDELTHFVRQFCMERGFAAQIDVHVHSSDSATFADRGIPAIGISRVTKNAEIHSRNDVIDTLSPVELERIGTFSKNMISRVANAEMIPIQKKISDAMKASLDQYFHRDVRL